MVMVPARALRAALAALGELIDGRTALPFPAHVLVEARGDSLRLVATDLDQTLAIALRAPGGEWRRTARCDALLHILRHHRADDEVRLDAAGDGLAVEAGPAFTLASLDPDEFLEFDSGPVGSAFELEADAAAAALAFVLPAVGGEGASEILRGLLIRRQGDELVVAATDAYRLALARLPAPAGSDGLADAMLSPGGARAVLRALADADGPVRFSFGDGTGMARVEVGNRTLNTKLGDCYFPDFRKLIPTELAGTLVVRARRIVEIARMAEALGPDESRTLRIAPFDDRVTSLGRDGEMTAALGGRCEGAVPKLFGAHAGRLRAFAENDDGELTLRFTEKPDGAIVIEKSDPRLSGMLSRTRVN